jgi:hypothetical protein
MDKFHVGFKPPFYILRKTMNGFYAQIVRQLIVMADVLVDV